MRSFLLALTISASVLGQASAHDMFYKCHFAKDDLRNYFDIIISKGSHPIDFIVIYHDKNSGNFDGIRRDDQFKNIMVSRGSKPDEAGKIYWKGVRKSDPNMFMVGTLTMTPGAPSYTEDVIDHGKTIRIYSLQCKYLNPEFQNTRIIGE